MSSTVSSIKQTLVAKQQILLKFEILLSALFVQAETLDVRCKEILITAVEGMVQDVLLLLHECRGKPWVRPWKKNENTLFGSSEALSLPSYSHFHSLCCPAPLQFGEHTGIPSRGCAYFSDVISSFFFLSLTLFTHVFVFLFLFRHTHV